MESSEEKLTIPLNILANAEKVSCFIGGKQLSLEVKYKKFSKGHHKIRCVTDGGQVIRSEFEVKTF